VALTPYLGLCIGIGCSISLDVFFATLARHKSGVSIKSWALPIAVTHTLFPALTFTAAWLLGQLGLIAELFINLIGFAFISLFLYEEFCEKIGVDAKFAIVSKLETLLGLERKTASNTLAILSVSWDALLFGPSLVAIGNTKGWSFAETGTAFLIIGSTVFICTSLAIAAAAPINQKLHKSAQRFTGTVAQAHYWSDLASFSVIGGFGILSLLRCVSDEIQLLPSIALSLIIWTALFYQHRHVIMQHECDEVIESVLDDE